jgi:L-fuconolactonase
VGWVDLTTRDVADRLSECQQGEGGARLVGLRHLVQFEPDPRWLARPEVIRGLEAVADANPVFDLLVTPPQLTAAIDVVGRLPQLQFVVDHLAKPLVGAGTIEPWRRDLAGLARHPNVACKLSGMVTLTDPAPWSAALLAPYVATVLELFGPERVMFGSDWPLCLLAASYGQVVHLAEDLISDLSPAEARAVFGDTARHVYSLKDPAGAVGLKATQ